MGLAVGERIQSRSENDVLSNARFDGAAQSILGDARACNKSLAIRLGDVRRVRLAVSQDFAVLRTGYESHRNWIVEDLGIVIEHLVRGTILHDTYGGATDVILQCGFRP